MDATRAGMGCGACKGLWTDVVDGRAEGSRRRSLGDYYVPGGSHSQARIDAGIRERASGRSPRSSRSSRGAG